MRECNLQGGNMFLRLIAVFAGIIFICTGVAGFLPSFMQGNFLFGLFEVDTMHNMVHIVSGVIAIMAATSYRYTRLYFQVFGVIYGLVAVLGFILKGDFFGI